MTIRPFYPLVALSAALLAPTALASSAAAQACYDFESEMPHVEGQTVSRLEGPIWAPTARWTWVNLNPPTSGHEPFRITQDPTGDMSLMGFGDWPTDDTVHVRSAYEVDGVLPTRIDLDPYVGLATQVIAYNTSGVVVWSTSLTSNGDYALHIEDTANGAPIAYVDIIGTDSEVWIQGVCIE